MTKGRRVAVTSPQTRLALARRGARGAGPLSGPRPRLTPAEAVLARRMHRRQLHLALTGLAVAVALLVLLPLALTLAPGDGAGSLRIVGVPVSWLAVAALPYPVLALLARWQLRRAEQAEDLDGRAGDGPG